MKNPPLHASRFKLNWANRHFQCFLKEAEEFFQANPPSLVTESDGDKGGRVVKLKWMTPLPDEIPAILGDCLHNLRSALDHAVVELSGEDRAAFSFYQSQANFEQEIIKKKYSSLSQKARDVIAAARPYEGGNDTLFGLDRARNIGSHRFLLPTATNLRSIYMCDAILYYAEPVIGEVGTFEDGIPIIKIAPGGEFLRSDKAESFKLGYSMLFGDVPGIRYKQVSSTIIEMQKIVGEIIDQFAATVE